MSTFELWVPLLTLFQPDGSPHREAIAQHLQWLQAAGANGVLVMGTTGEFSSLSPRQRKNYLEALCEVNPGLPVMVNIGDSALETVLDLQAHALQCPQVSRVLIMPPYYWPASQLNGLTTFLQGVLAAGDPERFRYGFYHYPKCSQVPVSEEILQSVSGLRWLKYTDSDLTGLRGLMDAAPGLEVFVGNDTNVYGTQMLCAEGLISALGNVIPHLLRHALDRQDDAAEHLKAYKAILADFPKLPALFALLQHQFPSTVACHPQPPLLPLTESQRLELLHRWEVTLQAQGSPYATL